MNLLSFLVFVLIAFLVCRGTFKKQMGGGKAGYIIIGAGILSFIGAGIALYFHLTNDSSPTPSPPSATTGGASVSPPPHSLTTGGASVSPPPHSLTTGGASVSPPPSPCTAGNYESRMNDMATACCPTRGCTSTPTTCVGHCKHAFLAFSRDCAATIQTKSQSERSHISGFRQLCNASPPHPSHPAISSAAPVSPPHGATTGTSASPLPCTSPSQIMDSQGQCTCVSGNLQMFVNNVNTKCMPELSSAGTGNCSSPCYQAFRILETCPLDQFHSAQRDIIDSSMNTCISQNTPGTPVSPPHSATTGGASVSHPPSPCTRSNYDSRQYAMASACCPTGGCQTPTGLPASCIPPCKNEFLAFTHDCAATISRMPPQYQSKINNFTHMCNDS